MSSEDKIPGRLIVLIMLKMMHEVGDEVLGHV